MLVDRRGALLGGVALTLVGCTVATRPPRAATATIPAPLTPDDFTLVIDGLDHAEGVASAPDGRLFLSNGGGAIGILKPGAPLTQIGPPLAANGVAVDPQGRIIVAHMGLLKQQPGPLQRVDLTNGTVETLVSQLEGRQLVASNGPATARDGTIYCTHSSWGPVANIGTTTPAGFIYMVRPDGSASIVARNLRGANGLCLDQNERHVYASLTAEGRIRRWRRHEDGTLFDPQDFGPQLGTVVPDQTVKAILALPPEEKAALGYCDGIAFDMAGNLWITLPFSNRLIALTPDGRKLDIVHDPAGERIAMPTNLCWGGADRRTLYVVSRGKGMIVQARTTIAGLPLANWPTV